MAVPAHEAFCTDLQKPRGCHQTFKSAALQSTLAQPWHRGYGKLWQAIAANHSNGDHVETVIELRFAPSSQQQLPSLIPQLPAVDGLETLGRSLISLRRSIER